MAPLLAAGANASDKFVSFDTPLWVWGALVAFLATLLIADALWVIRGGHYGDPPQLVRTTARGAAEPGARRPFIGFRVVVSPQ